MERIYITCADLRRTFNEIYHKEPSRFIFEIPDTLRETREYLSTGYQQGQSRRGFPPEKKSYTESHYDAEETVEADTEEEPDPDVPTEGPGESKFRIRDSVLHPKYGIGRVLSIEGSGDNLKLTILFGKSSKTFLEKYTPLEKA
jgi:DNA helicase-2/ATP-dependent DNA helicase PcrA